MKPSEFWQLTPAETVEFIKAFVENQKDIFKRSVTTAWLTAAFTRQKKLKPLNVVLRNVGDTDSIEPKSPDVLLKKLRAINEILGGRDLTNGGTDRGITR